MFIRNTLLPSHREEKKEVKIWPKDIKHLKNAESVHIWNLEDEAL